MKFYFADEDFENFSLSEDGMFALPVSVTQGADGEVTVTSYKISEDAALEFCSLFESDPFSENARAFLTDKLTPLMEGYSLYPTKETGDVLLDFRMDVIPCETTKSVILGTNEEVSRYSADTTLWRLEVDDEDPLDVICAVIENERIVCFAAVNDLSEESAEINVECALSARRKGYATQCVKGLTRHILSHDAGEVSYVCRERNVASVKTAIKAGFTLKGKSMNFVFYR